ncbi:hypothetical protein BGZ73_005768 [Actinomortierella ambigua]|nr:hypothetical protein BGZ73_005768 [Actinomortierella ambigua]
MSLRNSRPNASKPPTSQQLDPLVASNANLPPHLKRSFWYQEGMSTLLDWVTTPGNWAKLRTKLFPVNGQRPVDPHWEIAALVKANHGVSWTDVQVRTRIYYMKKRYFDALDVKLSDEDSIHRQREICPLIDRLRPILADEAPISSVPTRRVRRKDSNQDDDYEDEGVPDDETDEKADVVRTGNVEQGRTGSHIHGTLQPTTTAASAGVVTVNRPDNASPNTKRQRREEELVSASFTSAINMLQHHSDRQCQDLVVQRTHLRAREEAVEQRERELTEKLLRLSEDAYKRADEARAQLQQELEAERIRFQNAIALERTMLQQEKDELKRDKEDLKRERDELKREREQFMEELYTLRAENAVLTTGVQVRLSR